MSNALRGAIYGLTAAAIWGGMYVVSDKVLETVPPFTLLVMRVVLGALVLGFLLYRSKISLRTIPRNDVFKLLGVGLMGFGISLGAQFVGTEKSTAVNGALVTSASPAFILIFAALLLHERLTTQRIIAVVLATIGVLIIIDPSKANFSSETFSGDIALAVAALTWGLYSVLVRMVSQNRDTLVITFIGFLGGLCFTIPAAGVELTSQSVGEITFPIILGILYLGVISTAGAMWLWNRAFALVDASIASLFFFAQPLVGALLGVLLLGQQMTPNLWVGGFFIAIGVLLSLVNPHILVKRVRPALSDSAAKKSV